MTIAALVCTLDTPLATEACIKSLRHFNRDVDMEIYLVASPSCGDWVKHLAVNSGALLQVTEAQMRHDELLTSCFDDVTADLVLTLDTDVTFHGPGLISEMAKKATPSQDCFAVGCDKPDPAGTAWFFPKDKMHWENHDVRHHAARVPVYLALWRKAIVSPDVQRYGFYCAMLNGPGGVGRYYDTAALLTDVLRSRGLSDYYVPSGGRFRHWKSVSWLGGEYEKHRHVFERVIRETTW